MTDRDFKLNSISRYSKKSPQLVLEEHNHCEVPAGCGGVVLRWTNPNQAIPLGMWLEVNGEAEFYLDGEVPSTARPFVDFGEHVLAFQISNFKVDYGLLMFGGIKQYRRTRLIDPPKDAQGHILSVPDGSWKYSLTDPQNDFWKQVQYDDSEWSAMIEKPLPASEDKWKMRRVQEWQALGVRGLGIRENIRTVRTVWVRKIIDLSQDTVG